MTDYKELIDQVRTCIARGCDCCNQESTCKYDLTCNGIFDYHLACADAIEQLVKERDAAVEDIKKNWLCFTCKKRIKGREWAYCKHLELEVTGRDDARTPTCENWEWRGVQE